MTAETATVGCVGLSSGDGSALAGAACPAFNESRTSSYDKNNKIECLLLNSVGTWEKGVKS